VQSHGNVEIECGCPKLLLMEAGKSCSRSGNSDCTSQCDDESDEADNDSRNVKFRHGKKRPRRSHLEIIAPRAWEKQALGWDEKCFRDAKLKDRILVQFWGGVKWVKDLIGLTSIVLPPCCEPYGASLKVSKY